MYWNTSAAMWRNPLCVLRMKCYYEWGCSTDCVLDVENREIAVHGVFCFSLKNGSIHCVIYSQINKEIF